MYYFVDHCLFVLFSFDHCIAVLFGSRKRFYVYFAMVYIQVVLLINSALLIMHISKPNVIIPNSEKLFVLVIIGNKHISLKCLPRK